MHDQAWSLGPKAKFSFEITNPTLFTISCHNWYKNILIWYLMGFPGSSDGKEPVHNAGELGKITSKRKWQPSPLFLPGEFHGQRSLAGAVHGVTKSWTRLSDQHTHPHPHTHTHTHTVLAVLNNFAIANLFCSWCILQ